MGRYIDADYVNAFPIRIDHYDEEHGNRHFVLGIESVMEYIEEAPSIDIVRCKECKYCLVGVATAQYSNGKQRIENLCEKHKWSVRADDFCSYGERKESE